MILDPRAGLVSRTPSQDITRFISYGYDHEDDNRASTQVKKAWQNLNENLLMEEV